MGQLSTISVTKEILKTTNIGVVVNRLGKDRDPHVAKAALDLVKKWREAIKKRGKGIKSGGNEVIGGNGNTLASIEKIENPVNEEEKNHHEIKQSIVTLQINSK